MLRQVQLPADVSGRLLLHSMPGRREPIEDVWRAMRAAGVSALVNLTEEEEIRRKSPDYAAALKCGTVPCRVILFPIRDFSVPSDRPAFWQVALQVAEELRVGVPLLIHCAGGIGRTGTLASAVLVALGQTPSDAKRAVRESGSGPETSEQHELLVWCATQSKP